MLHKVYLGLGANLGNRVENLNNAIRLIGDRVGEVVRQSSFIETTPWGFTSEHLFLNAAVLCLTELSPREVLTTTQQIEREMGRRKNVEREEWREESGECPRSYHDRPIDIDILLYDDITVHEPDLIIPHPLMHERDFVMIPLREICDE